MLLRFLVKTFVPSGPLVIGVDETLERRWGKRIAAKGIYRDPVRSTHERFVKASGLRWGCLMLLVPVPWAGRVWALPFHELPSVAIGHEEVYHYCHIALPGSPARLGQRAGLRHHLQVRLLAHNYGKGLAE